MANSFYENSKIDGEIMDAAVLEAIEDGFDDVEAEMLKAANNLSDIDVAATARTNLGLTATATLPATTWCQTANNLSDVDSLPNSRSNLGLGSAAEEDVGTFCQVSNNLSDVAVAATARTNLGLGSAAEENVSAFCQTANNLSDVTAATARTNLGLGDSATRDVGTTAGDVAQGDHTHAASGLPLTGGTLTGNLAIDTTDPSASNSITLIHGPLQRSDITFSDDGGAIGYVRGDSSPDVLTFAKYASNHSTIVGKIDMDDGGLIKVTDGDFILDSDVDFGIGTDAPAAKVHINDGGTATTPTLSTGTAVKIQKDATTTTDCGVAIVAGNLADSFIDFGDPEDVDRGRISYNHSSAAMTFKTNNSNQAIITSGGALGVGTTTPAVQFHVNDAGTTSVPTPQTSTLGIFQHSHFSTDNAGIAIVSGTAANGFINFSDANDNDVGQINYDHDANDMTFTAGASAEFTFGGDGTFLVDAGGDTSLPMTAEGCTIPNDGVLALGRNGSVGNTQIVFYRSVDTTTVSPGGISTTSTTTTYNTSSDYRLKYDIQPLDPDLSLNRLNALKPCTYKWKLNDDVGEGFIAHELQEVAPDAATLYKDALDKDGNPEHQGVDLSKIVPLLTSALQTAVARIENLELRVSELEG